MKKIALISHRKQHADRVLHKINDELTRIIEQAGHLPIGIPLTEEGLLEDYAEMADAYIFLGTDDLNPFYYGQEPTEHMSALDLSRDSFCMALFRLVEGNKPVLGINYGMHLINVAMGGTLKPCDTHIIHEAAHGALHSLQLEEDSFLYPWYGKRTIVNSQHRYQVDNVGFGLEVAARCQEDIEALQDKDSQIYAIQWNPEQDDRAEMHRVFYGFFEMV